MGDDTGIEITPEMIEAGLEAYANFLEAYRSPFETAVVKEIYAAMERVRRMEVEAVDHSRLATDGRGEN